jgi:hypothetical protein
VAPALSPRLPPDPRPAAARNHLRLLLALKCGAFALGAAQLRCGYPPRADASNGMGRHTFWFMRRVSTPRAIAFNAFLALPFVYELRQLLDYATTPSTLTLMDWLKLEEINYSLYLVTWNRWVGGWVWVCLERGGGGVRVRWAEGWACTAGSSGDCPALPSTHIRCSWCSASLSPTPPHPNAPQQAARRQALWRAPAALRQVPAGHPAVCGAAAAAVGAAAALLQRRTHLHRPHRGRLHRQRLAGGDHPAAAAKPQRAPWLVPCPRRREARCGAGSRCRAAAGMGRGCRGRRRIGRRLPAV